MCDYFNHSASNKKIYYVDGLCGSGKTYSAIKTIQTHRIKAYNNQSYDHGKWIIATPSCELSRQIFNDFPNEMKDRVHLVNESTVGKGRVLLSLYGLFKENKKCNYDVIIIQQQLLPFINKNIPYLNKYNLIVDEIPQIDNYFSPKLKYNSNFITKHVEVADEFNTLYRLQFKEGQESDIKQIIKRKSDDVYDIFKDFYSVMCNGYMFADKVSWDRNMDKEPKGDGDKVTTHFLGIMSPKMYLHFKSVTIMGAHFTESMAYQLWSLMGYQFVQHKQITKSLRFVSHDHIGKLLNISYMQGTDHSKRLSQKEYDGMTVKQMHVEIADKLFKDENFLFVSNNDDKNSFKDDERAIRIPVISHGMNSYQDHTNIFFSPSLNRKPKHLKMLGILGISSDIIARSTVVEVCYQAIMRTALRNPNSTAKINVLVVDKRTAEGIAINFKNSTVKSMVCDNVYKMTEKHTLTNKELMNRKRHAKYVKELEKFFNENNDLQNDVSFCPQKPIVKGKHGHFGTNDSQMDSTCDQSPKPLSGWSISSGQKMTVFSNKYNSTGIVFDDVTDTMSLVATLKSIHTNNVRKQDEKEDMLWSGALFKDNHRCDADMISTRTIMIDIDGGDVSKEDMKELFKDYSFVIMNTHSTSSLNPNNYRMLFFVDTDIDNDEYSAIVNWVDKKINTIAYTDPKKPIDGKPFCAFDKMSQKASQVFYFPCQVVGRKEYSFFEKNRLKEAARIKYITIEDYYTPSMNVIEKPKLVLVNKSFKEDSRTSIINTVMENGIVDNRTWFTIMMAMKALNYLEIDAKGVTMAISEANTTRLNTKKWNELWKSKPKMNERQAINTLKALGNKNLKKTS